MQLFRKIATNTLWQVVARVVSSGVSFLITILIARSLGVEGYGDLAKITAFVSLFYLVIDLGLNAIFLQREDSKERFRDLLYYRLFLAFILFLLVVLGALFLPYNTASGIGYSPLVKFGIALFGLTFFGQAMLLSSTVLFQKNYTYKLNTYATVISSGVTIFIVGLSLFFHLPFIIIVGSYAAGSLTGGLVSLLLVNESLTPFSMDKTFVKTITISTLPIALMLFLNLIYFRVDMILLSLNKATYDVAVYDFAYKFFDFLIALPLFLSNSIYPALLASEKNTRISFPKLMAYTLGFGFLGLVLAIPVWFASPLLAFVKNEFIESSFALRLLILSLPIFFATNIVQWIFIAKKKQAFLVFVYGGSLVLNILLNLIFIPHYSYVASAIITGVSEAGVLLALLLYALFANV